MTSSPGVLPADHFNKSNQAIFVGLGENPDFNPNDFHSITNSQVTAFSSSQPHISVDDELVLATGISQNTVPDSQEFSGQSLSYHESFHLPTVSRSSQNDEAESTSGKSEPPSRQPDQNSLASPLHESLITEQESVPVRFSSDNLVQSSVAGFQSQAPLLQTFEDILHSTPPLPTQETHSVIQETQHFEFNNNTTDPILNDQDYAQLHEAQAIHSDFYPSPTKIADSNSASTEPRASGFQSQVQFSLADSVRSSIRSSSPNNISASADMADNAEADAPLGQGTATDELNALIHLDSIVDPGSTIPDSNGSDFAIISGSPTTAAEQPTVNDSILSTSDEVLLQTDPVAEPAPTALDGILSSEFVVAPEKELADALLAPPEEAMGTISPSDILASGSLAAPISFGTDDQGLSIDQQFAGEPFAKVDSIPGSPLPLQSRHVVTLPFQANIRPQYDDALLASRQYISKFAGFFAAENFVEPDQELVQKIDAVFSILYDFCDYPQDAVGTSIESLSTADQVKYACDANSKFDFVCGFLKDIRVDTRVLIVARSVELIRLLHHITVSLNVGCSASALGVSGESLPSSAVSVTLALPSEELNPSAFNVVIGFDHAFGQSAVGRALSDDSEPEHSPLVLLLVAMYSVEHIDAELHENLTPLERKNAFLSCIVNARRLMADSSDSYLEPREVALKFSDYVNGATSVVIWKPVSLPSDVLDIFMSSQARSYGQDNDDEDQSRKRKLEDDSDDEATDEPKRMRVLPRADPSDDLYDQPLSDEIQGMLSSVSPSDEAAKLTDARIRVSLGVLQVLAEKFAELDRQVQAQDMSNEQKNTIDVLEKRVKEYENTSGKIYKRLRTAIEDRTKFNLERKKAEENLEKAKAAAEKQAETAQAKIADLEATIARLTGAGSEGTEKTPLAQSEELLKEAESKVDSLTKRVKAAQTEGEYARKMYQDASTTAASLRSENIDLTAQIDELRRKASDNLAAIKKTQAESETKTYLRRIRSLQIELRERELDLDRTKDELRQIRSARRDTRGGSVPRSPRMGMMSPRPGRAYGASASRGTSPAPVPGVEGAVAGNGRFNHLRE